MSYTDVDERQKQVKLFTDSQYEILLRNGANGETDNIPVAYLVQSDLNYQWLISELYLAQPNTAYGLSYLNTGKPTLGYIDLKLIEELNATDKSVLNHPSFQTTDRLSLFRAVADELGYIVIREEGHSQLFSRLRKIVY